MIAAGFMYFQRSRPSDFLARHGDDYARRLSEQYRLRARRLLCQGRTREARADLRRAGAGPPPTGCSPVSPAFWCAACAAPSVPAPNNG